MKTPRRWALVALVVLAGVPAFAQEGRRLTPEALAKLPDAKARVEALLGGLDRVTGRGASFDSWTHRPPDFCAHPLVARLLAEGDAAVEPLLTCLATDKRLSLATSSSGEREPVGSVAYAALGRLLRMRFGVGEIKLNREGLPADAEARAAVAGRMRAWWAKVHGLPPAMRYVRTLPMDDAPAALWGQAALNLVYPADANERFPSLHENRRVYDDRVPLRVELPDEARAEVTRLIGRRMLQMLDGPAKLADVDDWNFRAASAMAEALIAWDAPGSVEPVRRVLLKLQATLALPNRFGHNTYDLLEGITTLHALRTAKDVPGAIDDYAAWMRGIGPAWLPHFFDAAFQPLVDHGDDPRMEALAKRLFDDENSPWVKALDDDEPPYGFDRLYSSNLVLNAVFRARMLRDLGDRTVLGKLQFDKDGRAVFYYPGWNRWRGEDAELEKLPEGAPAMADLRRCDYAAWRLSRLWGTPRFMPWADEKKRDAEIARLKAFVERHGAQLLAVKTGPTQSVCCIVPPTLKRPATREDVEAGRAFFSLLERGEVRLPDPPIPARWATWTKEQDRPYVEKGYLPGADGPVPMRKFHRDGLACQPQEVLRDGKWRRYYTFISRYGVALVPAEEIELPEGGWPDVPLEGAFDSLLWIDGLKRNGTFPWPCPVGPGKPLVITLRLTNRSGADRSVGANWVQPGDDGVPMLPAGVEVRVLYLPTDVADEEFSGVNFEEDFAASRPQLAWQRLQPKSAKTFEPVERKRLRPGESSTPLTLDVSKRFDTTRPGYYAVQVIFSPQSGFAHGRSVALGLKLPQPARW